MKAKVSDSEGLQFHIHCFWKCTSLGDRCYYPCVVNIGFPKALLHYENPRGSLFTYFSWLVERQRYRMPQNLVLVLQSSAQNTQSEFLTYLLIRENFKVFSGGFHLTFPVKGERRPSFTVCDIQWLILIYVHLQLTSFFKLGNATTACTDKTSVTVLYIALNF